MDNYEYRHLMPVAELIARLSEEISRFLDVPAQWNPCAMDDDEATSAIARIRAEVHTALHSFAMERVVEQHLTDWGEAFAYAGRGSTYERAQVLREIYRAAAPVPGCRVLGSRVGVSVQRAQTGCSRDPRRRRRPRATGHVGASPQDEPGLTRVRGHLRPKCSAPGGGAFAF